MKIWIISFAFTVHTQRSVPTKVMHEKYYRQYVLVVLGSKFQAGHLLLSSTIMAHLWKLCLKIWLYVCSSNNEPSAIWESQHVHFILRTHTHCIGNDLKRFFKQPRNIRERHVLRTDLLPLVLKFGTKKRKLDSLFYLSGNVQHWSIYMHSVLIWHQTSPYFILPLCVSHRLSHGEVSTNRSVNMLEFEQGVSPKLRGLGEIGLSL